MYKFPAFLLAEAGDLVLGRVKERERDREWGCLLQLARNSGNKNFRFLMRLAGKSEINLTHSVWETLKAFIISSRGGLEVERTAMTKHSPCSALVD